METEIERADSPQAGEFICQNGVVERVEGELAFVRLETPEGCDTCATKHSCGAHSSAGKLISVKNEAGAREGQRVELAIRSSAILTASFLLFIVPLFACLAGLAAGYALALALDWPAAEWIGLAFGAGGFAAAYLLLRLMNKRFERSGKYEPVISRILI